MLPGRVYISLSINESIHLFNKIENKSSSRMMTVNIIHVPVLYILFSELISRVLVAAVIKGNISCGKVYIF